MSQRAEPEQNGGCPGREYRRQDQAEEQEARQRVLAAAGGQPAQGRLVDQRAAQVKALDKSGECGALVAEVMAAAVGLCRQASPLLGTQLLALDRNRLHPILEPVATKPGTNE